MIPVVLACCSRDQDQALRLLNWCAELGMHQTKLYLLCSNNCAVDQLMSAARRGFSEVKHLPDVQEVDSNWHEKGNHYKSAAGPNSLFNQAAWNFYGPNATEWLFLEPDAIPCHPNWLRDISEEYELCKRSGKLFLGYEVTRNTHPGDVGHHMSGVAVYPPNVPNLAHRAVAAGDTAFDIEGAEQIVPQMMPSKLIFHRYRPEGFTTQEDFEERVPKHYAIYHACKDGSIIPFLRSRLGLTNNERVAKLANAPDTGVATARVDRREIANDIAGSSPATLTCDIFIKTREHDYPWLEWCLRSIDKHCSGFRKIVLIHNQKENPPPSNHSTPTETKQWSEDWLFRGPGYLEQQCCKLYADVVTDAEYILFTDSDTVFTKPINPDFFLRDGMPTWRYTKLDNARQDQHHWVGVMEKFLGKKPENEFMREHPEFVPSWALKEMRMFCKYKHGVTLEEYIMSQKDPNNDLALVFSEWNCLGFFLWEFHRDKIHWLDDSEGHNCTYQGHTHSGEKRKQEDLAKFREILGEPESITQRPLGGGTAESRLTLESCIEYLAQEAGKDGFAKARILRQLKTAWKDIKAPVNGKPRGRKKSEPPREQNKGFLLCIHSYPGANETVERHWSFFKKSGATRIAGIGTTDGECVWPKEIDWVHEIGENKYIKGDHLCRRLLDTIKWCMTQPEDHFMIAEYDVVFLKKIPLPHGVCAHLTGGQVNGSKTSQFFHGPWCFDRASGAALIAALEAVLPECQGPPDNSPDLFFGLACERAQIKVGCGFKMFTRNSLDEPNSLDLAVESAVSGVHCIHGVKRDFELQAIQSALSEKHLSNSHLLTC